MASLLETGKTESARIRVENIIRSDIITELHEILELYCELLLARIGMMEGSTCDPGLEEAVKSIMYAAPRIEVKEVQQVRLLLAEKYGKEFAKQAAENSDGKVNEKVVQKLSIRPPAKELVDGYLEEIASTYGVDWPKRPKREAQDEDLEDDASGPDGGVTEAPIPIDSKKADEQDELVRATPPRDFGPSSPLRVTAPNPSSDNPHPTVKAPSNFALKPKQLPEATKKVVESKGPVKGAIPDIDELAARFAALKK